MEKVVIFGAGGHGRVCADVAEAQGLTVAGFLDAAAPSTSTVNGIRFLGKSFQDLPTSLGPGRAEVFIAIGTNAARGTLFEAAEALGFQVPILRHPSAIISRWVEIGRGTVVMPGAIVNANTRIGRYCILNTACSLDHDNTLEDGAQICPGVHAAGNVYFGAHCFVGTGATIKPGVKIGRDAIVGAGAVVVHDVPASACVVGNPAAPIRRRMGKDVS